MSHALVSGIFKCHLGATEHIHLGFPKLSKQISLVHSLWASLFFCKPAEVNLRGELTGLSTSRAPVVSTLTVSQAVAVLPSAASVERTTGKTTALCNPRSRLLLWSA